MMKNLSGEREQSLTFHGLIWFGAAISIAEFLTGTLFAPLGTARAWQAILLGHVIGGGLMFLAGVIGGKSRLPAMESVRLAFGRMGARFFAGLNVLQLIGWTAVMISSGAAALHLGAGTGTLSFWCLILGGLILFWLWAEGKFLSLLNCVAMSALFLLTVGLSVLIFQGGNTGVPAEAGLSFGAAVELAAAMPISWLPLIADYTSRAERPVAASGVSCMVYVAVSSWMYGIGMLAALYLGTEDMGLILTRAGFGLGALLILVLSTVTTTFLDVYSAGVSSRVLEPCVSSKKAAVLVCLLGTVLAIAVPVARFEDFLYAISSVFAPMMAILMVSYFFLHQDASEQSFVLSAFVFWGMGVFLYRIFMTMDTPLGNTLPVMVLLGVGFYLWEKVCQVIRNRAVRGSQS